MNLSELGEFGLIGRLHQSLAQRCGVRLGIGDDAAILEALSAPVITCDALIEHIHFRLDWTTWDLLGWKAMAVNVSDIAAMGGEPIAAFVCLALPTECTVSEIESLYKGMESAAQEFNFTIAGGDTTKSSGPLMISVTLIGNAPRPVLRSGAQNGDVLLVTGDLGASHAALQILQQPGALHEDFAPLLPLHLDNLNRHLKPTPRLNAMRAALQCAPEAIHAALDLSDGLAGDAGHIARASHKVLEIKTTHLPISTSCRAIAGAFNADAIDWALSGGEDYELLLCVAPGEAEKVRAAIENSGTPCTAIGRVTVFNSHDAPVMLLHNEKREPASGGFAHF